jgi:phosphoribosylaminoimidazole-succinocarboxamide synthase
MLIQQSKEAAQSRRHGGGNERSQHNGQHVMTQTPKMIETEPTRKPQNSAIAVLANEISSYLFKYLAGFRIPTHCVEKASIAEAPVRPLAMIPLQVRVHNVASGAFSRQYGVKEGTELAVPVIEHYYKSSDLGNPMVNEFHIYSLGLATPEQLRTINRLTSKTNVVLKSFFERRELKLLSANLEFGITGSQVAIGDEISPRTCHFADLQKKDHAGKDIFADGSDETLELYTEVRNRIYRTF